MFSKEDVYNIFAKISSKRENYYNLMDCKEPDVDSREFFCKCMTEMANDNAVEEMNRGLIQGLPVISIFDANGGIIEDIIADATKASSSASDFFVGSMLFITNKKVKKIGCEELGGGAMGSYIYMNNIVSYVAEDCKIIVTDEVHYYFGDVEPEYPFMIIRKPHANKKYSPLLNCMEDFFDDFYKELWDK